MLTDKDKELLKAKGISEQQVENQLSQFKTGFPFADIQRPATVGDGIAKLSEQEEKSCTELYEQALAKDVKVTKFVPASGAATRMFKNIFEYVNAAADKQAVMRHEKPYSEFFDRYDEFAFSEQLNATGAKEESEKIRNLVAENGLDYGRLPKGLVSFHRINNTAYTAAEEHLFEAAKYAKAHNGNAYVHFTVNPKFIDQFKKIIDNTQAYIADNLDCKLNITYSFQKPSTDTIAATMSNEPFRDENGQLVFRPGGHGALIENLNEIESEFAFIKNIDNVRHQHSQETSIKYKKILAGYAMELKAQIDSILKGLDKNESSAIKSGLDFIEKNLKTPLPNDFASKNDEQKAQYIYNVLDRPLRVCGMVKNEGEPGGGPFWVKGSDGRTTLQIVESAQIDANDTAKVAIMKKSTHFNPVDLFCCLHDRNGKKYDLLKYIDPKTGFISYKSLNGKELKALELPGLWNGAMANWLTFFVEVPVETFAPVKTVFDLLRPQHQPQK